MSYETKATPRGLVRATLGAIAAAAAICTLFWLPAEYGLDPTGLGRFMGLTRMGEIKQQLHAEAAAEDTLLAARMAAEQVSADPALIARLDALETQIAGIAATLGTAPGQTVAPAAAAPAQWRDEVSYTLAPTQGIEIKLVMDEGARAEFAWTANGSILNYDTHGDGGGRRISYEKGRGVAEHSGELIAAFAGNHGWFWRNRTDAPVTLTLRTRGDYARMKAP